MLLDGDLFQTPQMDQPLSIDKTARLVLREALKVVDTIIKKREEMIASADAHKPLVVLAGETHAKPLNRIFNIIVINELAKREKKLKLALEEPHNELDQMLNHVKKLHDIKASIASDDQKKSAKEHESAFKKIKEMDQHGRLTLKALKGNFDSDYAPYSKEMFLNFLDEKELPIRFSDVARTEIKHDNKFYITFDKSDPSTLQSLRACLGDKYPNDNYPVFDPFYHISEEIDQRATIDREAIQVRNHHMAKPENADFIYHQCGVLHVLGEAQSGNKPEHSLSAYYKQAGAEIIKLFLSKKEQYFDSSAELNDQPDLSLTPEIPDILATNDGVQYEDIHIHIHSIEEEETFVRAILGHPEYRQRGLDKYAIPSEDLKQKREDYEQQLDHLYEKMLIA